MKTFEVNSRMAEVFEILFESMYPKEISFNEDGVTVEFRTSDKFVQQVIFKIEGKEESYTLTNFDDILNRSIENVISAFKAAGHDRYF